MKTLTQYLQESGLKDFSELNEVKLTSILNEFERKLVLAREELMLKEQHLQMSFEQVHSWMLLMEEKDLVMKSILDSSRDMIITIDGDHCVMEFNYSAEEYFGLKFSEIKGQNIFGTIKGFDEIQKVIKNEFTYEEDGRKNIELSDKLVNKRNEYFNADILISKIKTYKVDIITLYIRDITLDLKAREDLDHMRAVIADAGKLSSLGEMASGIAHEINNPLAIIMNTISYLKKQLEKGSLTNEKILDCVGDIDATVDRISKIVRGLRNVSRDSAEEKSEDTLLEEIFSDVFSVCRERFKNHDVNLEIVDPQGVQYQSINCYRVQLSQVLMNLIGNAFDAVEMLDEKWVKLEVKRDENSLTLSVIDSGPGVAADKLDKIFLPFFTTKEIGKGTGLGLSLSRTLIERQGGTLRVNTQVPNTCFEIKIPLKS